MKSLHFLILIILSSLLSCTKTEILFPSYQDNSFEVTALASTDINCTRTTLNGNKLSWTNGDRIGVFVSGIQENRCFLFSENNLFSGSFLKKGCARTYAKYVSYYPYCSQTAGGSNIQGLLKSVQVAPFDAEMDMMVSDIVNQYYDEINPEDVSYIFNNHLFALVKINITNSVDSLKTDKISKITISGAPGEIMTGEFSVDIMGGEDPVPVFCGSTCDSVSVVYPVLSRPELGLGQVFSIYAVVNPNTISSLKVSICTSSHRGSVSMNDGYDVTFEKGCITTLPTIDVGTITMSRQKAYSYACVFMGDSITRNWKSFHPSFFSSNNFYGAGIGGQRTWEMLGRFQSDVIDRNPKVVIILAGTNNLWHFKPNGDVPRIRDEVAEMCNMAIGAGIIPIVCSICPVSASVGYNNQVKQANELLKEYAEDNGLYYVDYYSAMQENDVQISELFQDNVHPSPAGHTVMESICMPVIQAALAQ